MSSEKDRVASEVASEAQSELVTKPPPASDGGLFAWFQVLGGFFLMFNTWGLVNTYGVYQTQYQTERFVGTSASDISWIGSIQTFLLMFGAIIVGPLVDKGHLRPVLLTGSFLVVFGMMMTSLCKSYWQAVLSQGIVVGLGFACLFVPSVSVIPQYFQKRRAMALGVVTSGGSLGAIIYTIVFQQIQPKIGFGWATRVLAFMSLATLLIPAFGMRRKVNTNKAPPKFDLSACKDPSFNAVTCAAFFAFLSMYIPFFYIQLYSLSKDSISHDLNDYLLTLLNAGSLFGRLVPPYFGDKAGPLNSMLVCTACAAILGFSWIGIANTGGIVVFALLFGFFTGAFIALGAAVVASLTPDVRLFGLRMGLYSFPSSIGVLIGNPLAGALSRRSWLALQSFCGAGLVMCVLFLTAAQLFRTRGKVLVKV